MLKYKIYQLVRGLSYIDNSGYHPQEKHRLVLEPIDLPVTVEDVHPTLEAAVDYITKNKELFKSTRLTIMPVMSIDYDGELQENFYD